MDWVNDPQLKALRDEFIASFAERREGLAGALEHLAESLTDVRFIAHKLAGAAGSYGFQSLTDAGGALDDLITLCPEKSRDLESLRQATELLLEMISEALSTREDPTRLRADKRYVELIFAAESLLSEATS